MATRRLALLGTKQSPWVCLAHMRSPHLRVRGLPAGAFITASVTHEDKTTTVLEIKTNGLHLLAEGEWLTLVCLKAERSTICDVVSKAVA